MLHELTAAGLYVDCEVDKHDDNYHWDNLKDYDNLHRDCGDNDGADEVNQG